MKGRIRTPEVWVRVVICAVCIVVAPVGNSLAQVQTLVLPPGTEDRPGNRMETIVGNEESTRFQQFFSADVLSPAMPNGAWISGISFRRDDQTLRSGEVAFQSVEVILATTDRTINSVSPVFAENLGPDARSVYSQGPVAWSLRHIPGRANPFDAVLRFSAPFLYDPSKGNLLIDVRLIGADSDAALDVDGPSIVPPEIAFFVRASTAINPSIQAGDLNGGAYVTQISFSPIPEPSAIAFFAFGFVIMLSTLRHTHLR